MGKFVVAYWWSAVYSTEPWPNVCTSLLRPSNYLSHDLDSVERDVKTPNKKIKNKQIVGNIPPLPILRIDLSAILWTNVQWSSQSFFSPYFTTWMVMLQENSLYEECTSIQLEFCLFQKYPVLVNMAANMKETNSSFFFTNIFYNVRKHPTYLDISPFTRKKDFCKIIEYLKLSVTNQQCYNVTHDSSSANEIVPQNLNCSYHCSTLKKRH